VTCRCDVPPRSLADVSQDGGERPQRRGERLFGTPAAASAPRPPRKPTAAPRAVRWAALVVAVEGLGAAGAAVVLAWLTLTSTAASVSNAVAEVVLAVLAAVALAVCARALWRVAGWSRGPVVVLQLLLALLGYTTAFQGNAPAVGIPLLVLAAVELYLLATPEARLAFSGR
jgi:hypothetical protein